MTRKTSEIETDVFIDMASVYLMRLSKSSVALKMKSVLGEEVVVVLNATPSGSLQIVQLAGDD